MLHKWRLFLPSLQSTTLRSMCACPGKCSLKANGDTGIRFATSSDGDGGLSIGAIVGIVWVNLSESFLWNSSKSLTLYISLVQWSTYTSVHLRYLPIVPYFLSNICLQETLTWKDHFLQIEILSLYFRWPGLRLRAVFERKVWRERGIGRRYVCARESTLWASHFVNHTGNGSQSTKESLGNTFVHGFRSILSLVATAFKFRKRKKPSPSCNR